ncbi:predicted protein [Naegleria gruberi]|uniref:Predicted protein n=1 Tax=Naegleria gruberi TaxID=5762 RepID=D2VYV4_NAEGR|nr:uncharacterized protein NAEGRDRAFT_59623 [Naegleria gruberi]EFC37975.1 predicted protein [Naegleria gruberi]|eukprot:XP_002670719.1 predicted protein [Naegleria gruberi strain NEG-M]
MKSLLVLLMLLGVATLLMMITPASLQKELPITIQSSTKDKVMDEYLKQITVETIDSNDDSGNKTVNCCNVCPVPKIIIIPKYTTIKVPINIPYPVLKPIPPHHDDDVVDKCPSDYQFVPPNKCSKTIIIEKKKNCPIGFIRIGETECLRLVIIHNNIPPMKVVCPPGYIPFVISKNSEEYLKLKDLPKDLPSNDFFFKNDTKNTVLGCKKSKKIHIDEEIPHWTCPKGYYYHSPFHCVKSVECPKKGGWIKLTDGRCIRTLFKCPRGYKKVGRHGLTCIKINMKCPKGYRQSKKNPRLCLKTKIIVKIKCPKKSIYSEEKKTCIWKKCATVRCNGALKCPKGQILALKSKKDCCPSCVPCACSAEYHPVCTKDGVTVFNLCSAKCLGLEVKHEGECKITEIIKITKTCPPCDQCKNVPKKPVCGVDGVTYPNTCVAKCVTSGKFEMKRKGKCSPADCDEAESNKTVSEFLPFFERVLKSELINAKQRKQKK